MATTACNKEICMAGMKMEINPIQDAYLLHDLTESAAELLDHHIAVADKKMWYPHELIPFDEARTFAPDYAWDPSEYPLPDGVRSALYVNLLTEDNLPYYSSLITAQSSNRDHPFVEWGRRWTAEEGRHSEVIRGWIHAVRALDPRWLEDGRMAQVSKGEVPQPETFAELLAYTSFQELATKVAHRNTARMLPGEDKAARKVLAFVAGDEGLHYEFYSNMAAAGLEVDPSTMMIAIAKQLRGFKMPGTGIPEFAEHSKAIAAANIYTPTHFLESVVEPVLKKWDIDAKTDGLTAEGEAAHTAIHKNVGQLARAVRRFKEHQEQEAAIEAGNLG